MQTFIFPVYLAGAVATAGDNADTKLGWATTIAGILLALIAPAAFAETQYQVEMFLVRQNAVPAITSQFAPEDWRAHYLNTAARILERLQAARVRGELGVEPSEVHAWAIMGMNVFLGLRFGVLDAKADLGEVAAQANALLKDGLG